MSEIVLSKFSERQKLTQTTYGENVSEIQIPIAALIHKVYFHLLPNPIVAQFDVDAALVFIRGGAEVSQLPARVTTQPAIVYANLFPSSTDPTTVAENSIAIAYQGDATSYVLFPRVHIANADKMVLAIKRAINLATGAPLAAVKFYLAVDSASLPF